MQLTQRPDLGQLTFCVDIDRCESSPEVAERHLPEVVGAV
jgi:hypothetical protein